MPRNVTTVRLTEAARAEVEWLAANGYGSISAAIEDAVHRLYGARRPGDDMRWIRPVLETRGVAAVLELTLEQVRALPDDEARRAYQQYMEFLR